MIHQRHYYNSWAKIWNSNRV